MKKIIVFAAAYCLLSFFDMTGASCAEQGKHEKTASLLQSAYEKTTSLSADFRQETSMRMSGRTRKAEGKVVIKKPGRIRWDYIVPDRQVLVGDGKKFYMYFEKTDQMIVRSIDSYLQSDVTYSFFAGKGNILHDFDVQAGDTGEISGAEKNGAAFLKLIPKEPHPQLDFMNLWVDKNTHLIKRMQIIDLFGNTTDLFFSNIIVDGNVADDLFTFVPPEDTEIIEQN